MLNKCRAKVPGASATHSPPTTRVLRLLRLKLTQGLWQAPPCENLTACLGALFIESLPECGSARAFSTRRLVDGVHLLRAPEHFCVWHLHDAQKFMVHLQDALLDLLPGAPRALWSSEVQGIPMATLA